MKLIDQLIAERAEITAQQDELCTRAATDGRDLSDTEDANLTDLAARAVKLDERITQLREIADANSAAATIRADVTTRAAGHNDDQPATGGAKVNSEPLTYRDKDKGGTRSFFTDLYRAQIENDPVAGQHIARHQAEMDIEMRDSATANFAGLVIPQYLTSMAAELVRAGRPFANVCTRLPLPSDGMTVNVSRVTTGSSVAVQASENGAVTEATPDDTLLTVNVRTYAGMVDLSRQLVDRGVGTEELVIRDLASAYATSLDAGIIANDGTSGTHLGVLSTSGINDRDITDATPTAVEVWQQIIKGLGDVAANRYAPANIIAMHPRRWSSLYSGVDGSNRPLVLADSGSAYNPMGVGDPAAYAVVGTIAGVPVITDANIPTNLGAGTDEDRIIIARREDLLLWEQGDGAPMSARYDSVGSGTGTVRLVAFGYSAFTAGRYPSGITVIQGDLLDTAGL